MIDDGEAGRHEQDSAALTMLFAAYVRTSTDDHQSPDDSRRWQLSVAEQLIAPHAVDISAVYHDIDVSR